MSRAAEKVISRSVKHGVNVCVVQYQKALWIPHRMAVLLEHGDAETVEGVDIARVIVAGEDVDALAHLICGFVGEGDAEDISRQDAQLVHQKGKTMGERPCLAGAGSKSFGFGHSLALGSVEAGEQIGHRGVLPVEHLFLPLYQNPQMFSTSSEKSIRSPMAEDWHTKNREEGCRHSN